MDKNNYGILLSEKDIKLQRKYFIEMTKLIGVNVLYRYTLPNKHWTTYTEIDSNYSQPELVRCIFNEYPDQRTMKKLGWIAELDSDISIISVPYDLPNIQVGCLFIIPSAIDSAKGRLFRVVRMSTIMIYPASISCAIIPEYENNLSNSIEQHETNSFNLMAENEVQPQFIN